MQIRWSSTPHAMNLSQFEILGQFLGRSLTLETFEHLFLQAIFTLAGMIAKLEHHRSNDMNNLAI